MLLSSKLTFKINLLTDNYLEIPHLLIQYKGEMFDMNFRSLQLSPQHWKGRFKNQMKSEELKLPWPLNLFPGFSHLTVVK